MSKKPPEVVDLSKSSKANTPIGCGCLALILLPLAVSIYQRATESPTEKAAREASEQRTAQARQERAKQERRDEQKRKAEKQFERDKYDAIVDGEGVREAAPQSASDRGLRISK